jgi:hypothetical protein
MTLLLLDRTDPRASGWIEMIELQRAAVTEDALKEVSD